MNVRVKRVDGFVELFSTDKYMLTTVKELHPAILRVDVFTDNGKRLVYVKRPFPFIYKHFIFKSEMLEGLTPQSEATEQNIE
jgi:hypothetical protein